MHDNLDIILNSTWRSQRTCDARAEENCTGLELNPESSIYYSDAITAA